MLNDLDRDVVFETGMMIDKDGGSAKAMPGDITAGGFPEKLVNATVSGFGSIDIIVNNAGYTWTTSSRRPPTSSFRRCSTSTWWLRSGCSAPASTYIREAAKKGLPRG